MLKLQTYQIHDIHGEDHLLKRKYKNNIREERKNKEMWS